jgi:hypothetical protein
MQSMKSRDIWELFNLGHIDPISPYDLTNCDPIMRIIFSSMTILQF